MLEFDGRFGVRLWPDRYYNWVNSGPEVVMADRVMPTVPLLIPCQEGHEEDGQVILLNPWAAVALPEGAGFPFDLDELWVFAQLTDGVGSFHLWIELRQRYDDGTERSVGVSEWLALEFPGGTQLGVHDALFRMTNVPFDEPGLYEFRLVADGEELSGHVPTLRILDWKTTL
jgi:hypothetical protein